MARVTRNTELEWLRPLPTFTGHGRLTGGHAKRPRPPQGAQHKPGKRPAPGRAAAIRHAVNLDQRKQLPREIMEAAGIDPKRGPRTPQDWDAIEYVTRNGWR